MGKREKKFNKRLIGAILGSAIVGISGFSMTKKGKSFWHRIFNSFKNAASFIAEGLIEMKKTLGKR